MKLVSRLLLLGFAISVLSLGCSEKKSGTTEISGEGDPKEVIELLKTTKPTGDLDARIILAHRLGAMGPRAAEAIPHLEKLTKDRNPTLARAAQDAIAKIKVEKQ